MLDKLKILTNSDNTALLELILEMTKEEVIAYCNYTEYDTRLDNVVLQIATIKFNRFGTEGATSQGYNGASESYLDDYPLPIQKLLKGFKRIKTL